MQVFADETKIRDPTAEIEGMVARDAELKVDIALNDITSSLPCFHSCGDRLLFVAALEFGVINSVCFWLI
jgi:hypothetical protein